MKHVPYSAEDKKSSNYPYHPAANQDNTKRWRIHDYYCTDLLQSNKTARRNYFGLVQSEKDSIVNNPTSAEVNKYYTVDVWRFNKNTIERKKDSYVRDHFRYIFNRIFNCQLGHVYDLPKVVKVGKH